MKHIKLDIERDFTHGGFKIYSWVDGVEQKMTRMLDLEWTVEELYPQVLEMLHRIHNRTPGDDDPLRG